MVKNLPAMQETRVPSLGWESPLEKGMIARSSMLAWRIPWTEGPGGLQSIGLQTVRQDRATNPFTLLTFQNMKIRFQSSQSWIKVIYPYCLPESKVIPP